MERLTVITGEGAGNVQKHVQDTLQEDFNMYDSGLTAAVKSRLPMNAIDALLDGYQETSRMAEMLQMPTPLMAERARLYTRGDDPHGTIHPSGNNTA